MWGTSSSEEKLAGDPGNVIEATSIGGRRSDFFTAGKLAAGNFGLLQQYRHFSDLARCPTCRAKRANANIDQIAVANCDFMNSPTATLAHTHRCEGFKPISQNTTLDIPDRCPCVSIVSSVVVMPITKMSVETPNSARR